MNLVTGATGIIGSHVVLELLNRGQEVKACRRAESNLEAVRQLFAYYGHEQLFGRIQWVEADVTDVFSLEEAMDGVTHVYHCAGLVSFRRHDRQRLMQINDTGTANVVTACLTKGITALCHVSSIGTINNLDHKEALHEGVFWKTSGHESDYAISKYNGERQVWRGMEEGLSAVIVNPGVVLAPGFWDRSSSRLFVTCYKGSRFYTEGTTGYVAAADVAHTMVELVSQHCFGQRYILVEGTYSFRHILTAIHRGLGRPVPSVRATRLAMNLGRLAESFFGFFTGREPRLTQPVVDAAFRKHRYSTDKIRKQLNYQFKPVDQAIDEACISFLKQNAK